MRRCGAEFSLHKCPKSFEQAVCRRGNPNPAVNHQQNRCPARAPLAASHSLPQTIALVRKKVCLAVPPSIAQRRPAATQPSMAS